MSFMLDWNSSRWWSLSLVDYSDEVLLSFKGGTFWTTLSVCRSLSTLGFSSTVCSVIFSSSFWVTFILTFSVYSTSDIGKLWGEMLVIAAVASPNSYLVLVDEAFWKAWADWTFIFSPVSFDWEKAPCAVLALPNALTLFSSVIFSFFFLLELFYFN